MYLTTIQSPGTWSSVHKDILFKFAYPSILAYIRNTGGKCRFEAYANPMAQLRVGDQIFATSGQYSGYHSVTKIINANEFLTDTTYSGDENVISQFLYVPEIEIWTGFGSGIRPTKKLATVAPSFDPFDQNRITLNVGAYLKSDFPIYPPVVGVDYRMFNQYFLFQKVGGQSQQIQHNSVGVWRAANTSIPNAELMNHFNSGAVLNPISPIRFSCGKAIYSQLTADGWVNSEIDHSGITTYKPRQVNTEEKKPFETETAKPLLING